MSRITLQTVATAQDAAKPRLQAALDANGFLPNLLAVENRPQSDPPVLEEQTQQTGGALGVNGALLNSNAGSAHRAEATLAGTHTQTQLATQVVEGGVGLLG